MLSNTCKYALRAVIYLVANTTETGEKIGIKKISEDLEIPSPFLGKILQTLAKKRILTSTKGPNGGFGIGKDVKKLSILDIVDVIDGPDVFNTCLISLKSCKEDEKICPVHKEYDAIKEQLMKMFKNTTIGQLSENAINDQINIKI